MALFDRTGVSTIGSRLQPANISQPSSYASFNDLIAAELGTTSASSVASGTGSELGASNSNAAQNAASGTSSSTAQVNKSVNDPVSKAFANKGSPTADLFSTNSTSGGVDPIRLGTTFAQNLLTGENLSRLTTIAARLGQDLPNSQAGMNQLMQLAGDLAKQQMFTPSFLSGGLGPFDQVASTIDDQIIEPIVESEDLQKFAEFASKSINSYGALAGEATSLIEKGFTEGLPMIADAFGNAIPNIPFDLDPNILNALKGIGSAVLGIATDNMCGSAYPYGYRQNMYNSLLGFSASNGILCLLLGFMQTQYFNASSRQVLRNNSWDISNQGMASVLNAVAIGVGPGTLQNGLGMASNIVRNGYSAYDIDEIADTIDTLGVEVRQIFTQDNDDISEPIWDPGKMRAAHPEVLDVLTDENFSVIMDESRELDTADDSSLPWRTATSSTNNVDGLPWLEN